MITGDHFSGSTGTQHDVAPDVAGQAQEDGGPRQTKETDERLHALRQEVPPRAHTAASRQG